MPGRRRSRSLGNDSFQKANEIDGLKTKLEQSGMIGKELLDELRGMKEKEQQLVQEINILQNVNTSLAVRLGESTDKNRKMTITIDRVLEDNRESISREDRLAEENKTLQSQLSASLSAESRIQNAAEMTTPRDIRISPVARPRGTTLPPDVLLLSQEDSSYLKRNTSSTSFTDDNTPREVLSKSPSPRPIPPPLRGEDDNGSESESPPRRVHSSESVGDTMDIQLGGVGLPFNDNNTATTTTTTTAPLPADTVSEHSEHSHHSHHSHHSQHHSANDNDIVDDPIPDSGDTSDIDSTPGDTMAAQLMVDGMCFGLQNEVDNSSFAEPPIPSTPPSQSPNVLMGTPKQTQITPGTPTITPPVTPVSQAIQYKYQQSGVMVSTSVTPPTEEPPSPFRRSVSGICKILSPKGRSVRTSKSPSMMASPPRQETPPMVLIERVADGPIFGGSGAVPGWGSSLPLQSSTPSTTVELDHSDSDTDSDHHMIPSSLQSDTSKRNSIAVENYCDGTANGDPFPNIQTAEFELSAWATTTEDPIPAPEVVKLMTVVADVPSLKQFEVLIKQKSPKRETRPHHHSTIYCIRQTLKCFLIELKSKLAAAEPKEGSHIRSRQLGIELRRIEKELGIVGDRFSDGSVAKSIEIVMRDYQHLRTLEGELLRQLHDLSMSLCTDKLERARYQSCLIREQKIVIKQKYYILKLQHLGQFYCHLQRILSAFFLIMRSFKFFPLSPATVPSRIRNFVELLFDMLPQTAILFESGLSIAHQSEPKSGAYSKFTLSDIDLVVDAVAMTLCKKHEQQLSMLTCGDNCNSSGVIGAADWCIGVVVESIRRGRANPCFPMADQLISWISGHRLSYEPGSGMAGRKPRALLSEDRTVPSVEVGLAGWKLPKDGQVVIAPPSHHLMWLAEGLFRCCGVRSYDGDLYGIPEAPRQMSFPLYGFKTDSQRYARECNMSPVNSLLWGATPSEVWLDDSEFLALNPILFIFSSPIPYTLLALPPPYMLSGGLLVRIPYTANDDSSSCSSVKPMRPWSSRTGIIAARRTGGR